MKKIFLKTLVVGLITIGMVNGCSKPVQAKADIQNTSFYINSVEEHYKGGDKTYTEYSNETWTVVNPKTNTYVLGIVELGDWEYEFKDNDELKKAVQTYSEYRKDHPIKFNPLFAITKIQTIGDDKIKLNQGDFYIELTDGTSGIYKNGKYIFQPVAMGDWDIEAKDFDQFMALVDTYISMNKEGMF